MVLSNVFNEAACLLNAASLYMLLAVCVLLRRVFTHIQGPYMEFLFGLSHYARFLQPRKLHPPFSVISKPHPNLLPVMASWTD